MYQGNWARQGNNENPSSYKKQWWAIGILITGILIFVIFLTYFIYHNREYLKKIVEKNDHFQGYFDEFNKHNKKPINF